MRTKGSKRDLKEVNEDEATLSRRFQATGKRIVKKKRDKGLREGDSWLKGKG